MRQPSPKRYRGLLCALFAVAAMMVSKVSAQEAAPVRLALHEAIERGLQANLSVLVADTRLQELEGTRTRRLANLLPRVRTQSFANLQNRNLRAFGISLPSVPEVIGPFSNFDFRVYADQNVIDLQSYHGWKASLRQLDAGKLDYQDARDLIVRSVAGLYLNVQAASARVDAAQARVNSAEALYKLAKDKHDVGTATGVDTLRAQVELANEQQSLLVARNEQQQALLVLARNIGMQPGTPLELAEPLQFQPVSRPEAESALRSALLARSDYMSLASQRLSLTEQQQASHARYYPKFSINGNYGALGRSLADLKGIGLVQGTLDFTLFDRDRKGEAQEITARLRRIDDQIADLQRGIDEDIRAALLNLESAEKQVEVAQQGRELAQRELDLTQDRFQSGVTNNVEVVTAQDALARAQENYILAVSRHMDARFALSRAVGGTERNLGQFSVKP
jgi:outer membrane protein TolC